MTIIGLGWSTAPKWAGGNHGSVTDHGEQSKFEGTHVSFLWYQIFSNR